MFGNIRTLVNRISQSKEGDGNSDTSSIRSHSASVSSGVFAEEQGIEAEGFLCPTCMTAFQSPDDLQSHYQSVHIEPGASYLCPVCRAWLSTASELEAHYSANHSSSKIDSLDSLRKQLNEISSTLNEERWQSEELKKELSLLQNVVKSHGTSEENVMYQQQLQGLQETKSLLTSEVVLLRKQLGEAIESSLVLKQEREKLEDRAARNSQKVVELQSTLDENLGLTEALKENITKLERELEHKSSLDDAEMLKRELASVQRMMDQLTVAKENERDELQKKLEELQQQHEALTSEHNILKESKMVSTSEGDHGELVRRLEEELKLQLLKIEEISKNNIEKSDQLTALQHMREETDVCVGQLREEVTSLQDMLNQARHAAEGQVSAKEDERLKTELELITFQQKVSHLENDKQCIQQTNQQLVLDLEAKSKEILDYTKRLKQMELTVAQLEEKSSRLENEKAELMVTIQQGEGSNTVIQQLQEDNARLHTELENYQGRIKSMETHQKSKEEQWEVVEKQLQEDNARLQRSLSSMSSEVEGLRSIESQLQLAVDRSQKESADLLQKSNQLDSDVKALQETVESLKLEIEEKNGQVSKVQSELSTVGQQLQQQTSDNQDLSQQLAQLRENETVLSRRLREAQQEAAESDKIHQDQVEDLKNQCLVLQNDASAKEKAIHLLKSRVEVLEPLTEAVEEQKQQHIRAVADWKEQEELLRGEKESLGTLSTHLKQQLEESQEEYRIHIQRLKTETDALIKDKANLTDRLTDEKEGFRQKEENWSKSKASLEEQITSLMLKLTAVEEFSAARNKKCQELEAFSEKYLRQKIELETRMELLEEEKVGLQNSCSQWETEVDRLKFNAIELRRRLEDSQAALHELGRENQSLQMENAKLQGRKWADDSEVGDCHSCQREFTLTVRKHHCRNCGQIFCNECSSRSATVGNSRKSLRVCESCFKELNSPR